uniref:TLC domain-containing protein n=1 Tax=Aureoumbra lagunensis TaxID=44058 RepID=A0A7S3K3Q4_9STRA|mmetsp:Transcript_6282/g.8812  ORF Transcript_6282/g.8812 Transcript_6282/m.8812 type:complete len:290 (-) Transcript_6282:130-999(-)
MLPIKRAARMSSAEQGWYCGRMILTLIALEFIFRSCIPVPKKIKENKKLIGEYKMKVIAMSHATFASFGALYAILSDSHLKSQTWAVLTFSSKEIDSLFVHPAGAFASRILTSITTAFFFWELLHLANWASTSNLDRISMIMHHFISIALWPASCKNRIAHFFLIHFEFSEISSPFLHLRWFARNFSWTPQTDLFVSALFASTFFFFRSSIVIPMLRAAFITNPLNASAYPFLNLAERIISVISLPLPFLLNALWTYQIVLMIYKTIRRLDKKKNNTSQTSSNGIHKVS